MRVRALILSSALVVTLAACGSGEAATPTLKLTQPTTPTAADGPDLSTKDFVDDTGQATVDVTARDNNFVEPYLTITAGTKVTFTNKGRNQHDVVPVEGGAFAEIPVDQFGPGSSGRTITFSKPGDYAYYCSLHGTKTKGMVGAIRVVQ